jgi:protein ImuA
MAGLRSTDAIAALRARIAGLENRPLLAAAETPAAATAEALPAAPRGVLTAIFTPELRNAGAALGFALGQARSLLGAARPAVIYLQLVADAQETGVPYGAGLSHFGFPPEALVIGRLESITELLWALEEAVCCRAVAAVVADVAGHHKALDFTASRRLSLRADAARTSIFLLRYGEEREASAACFRWRLVPEPSGAAPFDARAPAGPRFRATLEKGRMGTARQLAGGGMDLVLDWTENGFAVVGDGSRNGEPERAGAAPSGAEPAALGDRQSQAV